VGSQSHEAASRARRVIGFTPRRSDRCAITSSVLDAVLGKRVRNFSQRSGSDRYLLEDLLLLPDDPSDASEFVGHGDGSFVVPSEALYLKSPGTESVGVLLGLGGPEDGSSTMDEEHAQIGVSAFADATESAHGPTGSLSRSEADIAGEVTSGGEAVNVTDEGDQGGSGEPADAGDGQQRGNRGALASQRVELALEGMDSLLDVRDLASGLLEGESQGRGDL